MMKKKKRVIQNNKFCENDLNNVTHFFILLFQNFNEPKKKEDFFLSFFYFAKEILIRVFFE